MYKVKGATGLDVIPHRKFWFDVPLLVKVTGCNNNSISIDHTVVPVHCRMALLLHFVHV